jgi:hypothetical protein
MKPQEGAPLHPIARLAATSLEKGRGTTLVLSEPSLRRIEEVLAAEVESGDAVHAVESILALSFTLASRGSTEAAEALFAIACRREPALLARADSAKGAAAEKIKVALKRFRAWEGEEELSRAPRFGDRAPPDTLWLGGLVQADSGRMALNKRRK